jgi:hypothetical protein
MSNIKQSRPQVDEVLMQFAAEQSLPTAAQLHRYIEQFPQFREELVEFAASLVEDEFHGEPVETQATEAAAHLAVSHFHNFRYEFAKKGAPVPSMNAKNPISRLSRDEFGRLVERLQLPKQVVAKLRDRRVRYATIPGRLIDALASALEVTRDTVIAHLLASPQMARLTTSSLSPGEPREAPQESFVEALTSAHLSSEQVSEVMNRFSNET